MTIEFAIVFIFFLSAHVLAFIPHSKRLTSKSYDINLMKFNSKISFPSSFQPTHQRSLIATYRLQRSTQLRDILGLGPAEIGIILIVGLVLFGPETLKSLSKDVGRAAAELKEIPKTFKEGMDEGAAMSQVDKMKTLAMEKRKKRDEKLANKENDDEEEEEDS